MPSKQGALYLLITLVVFIGGINYANSLILAMAFTLISLFIVSILHTYRNLSGLKVSAGRSEEGYQGSNAHFEIILSRDASAREHHSILLSWANEKVRSTKRNERVISLLDESAVSVWLPLYAKSRGYLRPPRLIIASLYPLGLLRAWTSIQLTQQSLVYPKPIAGERLLRSTHHEMQGAKRVQGLGDFEGLRPYTSGDNPKHIAWKHYARGQGLNTKVFIDQQSEQIILSWSDLQGVEPEMRLSILCYWVITFSQKQQPFSLILPDRRIAEGLSDVHRQDCLEALALCQYSGLSPQPVKQNPQQVVHG